MELTFEEVGTLGVMLADGTLIGKKLEITWEGRLLRHQHGRKVPGQFGLKRITSLRVSEVHHYPNGDVKFNSGATRYPFDARFKEVD